MSPAERFARLSDTVADAALCALREINFANLVRAYNGIATAALVDEDVETYLRATAISRALYPRTTCRCDS